MARVIEFRNQTCLILPFARRGIEHQHGDMDARQVALEPLDPDLLKRKGLRMYALRFCVGEAIENDLLVSLAIQGIGGPSPWTNGFVSATLLKQLSHRAQLVNPEQVVLRVKAHRNLLLDCGLVVHASWVAE